MNEPSIMKQILYSLIQEEVISWLRHCATIQKIAGLISDRAFEIFYYLNTSGCTKALR